MSHADDVERICLAALERPAHERAAFLAAACHGDDALRQEVESLLAHASPAEQFLEHAAVEGSQALAGLSGLSLGQRLGPYHVTAKLGAGGMGEVYRARDTQLGRDVAIKILPVVFASDPDRLARFEREARVLASLNHPHIAGIYGIETTPAEAGHRVRALIMELVEGRTLAERIAQGRLNLAEALPIAKQIAEALDAAHERGIIHRDLKPANIKLRPDGTAKVLDFGLAKALDGPEFPGHLSHPPTQSGGATSAGVILGTAPYMSPEQARGQPLDKRTDIWAFGCVLYEMLAGRPAFAGATMSDTVVAILEREPDWSALPAAIPTSVRRLIRRCLHKDPTGRVRDIGDARMDLTEALAPPAEATVTPSAWTDAGQRALWIPVLLVGMLAGSLAVWSLRPAAPSPAPAGRFTISLPAGEQLVGAPLSLAISPNGAYLAFETSRRGGRALYLRALAGTDAKLVTETSNGYPFFSPDSEWLGFFDDGKMKKVPVGGGASISIADASSPRGASWGDDGTIVFAPQSRVGLSQVSADGGTPHTLTVLDSRRGETSHRSPMLLPGGRTVIYRAEGATYADGVLMAYSLGGGVHHVLLPDGGFQPRYSPTGHLVYLQGTNLMAVLLDVARLELTGPPTLVVEHAQAFSLSDTGSLVYGGRVTQRQDMVWVDRHGAVEPLPAAPHDYGHPRLSRDDGRIVMSIQTDRDRHIWLYEIARDALTRLTFDNSNLWPLWTPDSSRVIYATNTPGSNWDIFWKPADNTGSPEPLVMAPLPQIPRAISPDGKWLAFSEANPATGADLWLRPMREDGTARPLAQTRAAESEPAFSPDSRWIAYRSNESGVSEIHVKPVSDVPGEWQISVGGGAEPLWPAGGRELFFRDGEKMWAVDVATEPAFSAGKPRLLFEGPFSLSSTGSQNYDVSHDGKRFLMLRPQPSAPEPLHIVTNWFEELKRLVPTK